MTTLGLAVRTTVKEAIALGAELVNRYESEGMTVLLETETAQALGRSEGRRAVELVEEADPIVTLGGDGTLIGIGRHVGAKSPAILGVNFGHLGFLTEFAPEELWDGIASVLDGTARYAERRMLATTVVRDGKEVFASQAVNDAVVQKGARDPLMELDVEVDEQQLLRLRADGLIVATPTGSTAYALSANGAIMHPTISVMQVVPICAHSLTVRPIVLPLESRLGVRIPPYAGELFLTIDGQESFELRSHDAVMVTRAANKVKIVRSPVHSYFEILRNKLNWGIANQP